jgi:dopamine beta-monooxygenase
MCRALRMPSTPNNVKAHITSFQPLIQAGSEPYVHHILAYDCPNVKDSDLTYQGDCFSSNMPAAMKSCMDLSVVLGWSLGGDVFYFPPQAGYPLFFFTHSLFPFFLFLSLLLYNPLLHIGYPMNGDVGVSTVMIQMHYNNPNLVAGVVDSSGLSFNYTTNLRQYDAGTLQTGFNLDSIVIPPGQSSWPITGNCPASCTSQYIPAEGVTVVAAMLHSHLLGTALRATVIRNGIEYPLVVNDAYDFNYQSYSYVTPTFNLLPGDHVQTKCVYNSASRPLTTGMYVG